ncbi:hypothetical protein VNO77_35081 [Canavalia gladiata]|uniref:Uncharacterized protein n=1 Tax=Canavalia gladiata TaxID=3824 RepID=A0AAN9KH53_CANGL
MTRHVKSVSNMKKSMGHSSLQKKRSLTHKELKGLGNTTCLASLIPHLQACSLKLIIIAEPELSLVWLDNLRAVVNLPNMDNEDRYSESSEQLLRNLVAGLKSFHLCMLIIRMNFGYESVCLKPDSDWISKVAIQYEFPANELICSWI